MANGNGDSDLIKNIKKLKEFAILTQSVDFNEIIEDYTEFENKLGKREKILNTEPGKLTTIIDPKNVEFERDFDRGNFFCCTIRKSCQIIRSSGN